MHRATSPAATKVYANTIDYIDNLLQGKQMYTLKFKKKNIYFPDLAAVIQKS